MRVSHDVTFFVTKNLCDPEAIQDQSQILNFNDLLELTNQLIERVGITRVQRHIGDFSRCERQSERGFGVLRLVDAITLPQVNSFQKQFGSNADEQPLSRISDE